MGSASVLKHAGTRLSVTLLETTMSCGNPVNGQRTSSFRRIFHTFVPRAAVCSSNKWFQSLRTNVHREDVWKDIRPAWLVKSHLIKTISSKYSSPPSRWIRSTECKQRSRRKFSCNSLLEKRKRKQNTELIRLVYLFRSKRVFAFVAFIPILPAQGALEDELPRNTKF